MADLALLPNVLWTPDGGALENAIDGVRATITGGSTLLANAKFRNDYQRLTSGFPSLGYRASPEWTNLLYALNPDNTSFEGGTVGGYGNALKCIIAASTEQAQHGVYSLKMTNNAAGRPECQIAVAAGTAAGAQYTAAAMFKGMVGKSYYLSLYDDVSGATTGTAVTADGTWQLCSVTKTFNAGSTIRRLYLSGPAAGGLNGDIVYWDAISLVAGATVPQFEEAECVATFCTFPAPVSAAEPLSGLLFIWHPWAGNDGARHDLLTFRTAAANNPGWHIQKDAASNLFVMTTTAVGVTKAMSMAVTAVNMPAGSFNTIAFSLDASNTQRLALDGTLAAAPVGAGAREDSVPATIAVGTNLTGALQANCIILPYIYRGVAWGDEECQYMSSGAVTPYSPDRSAMYCHHPNKAIYALKAPYQYIDARRDN